MNPREYEAWYQTARTVQAVLPGVLHWGGFLAVLLRKPDTAR
jgi:hypothetical protein